MIAATSFSFAGRTLVAGDRFAADNEGQAQLLQAMGRALRDEGNDSSKKRLYRRRDMKAGA